MIQKFLPLVTICDDLVGPSVNPQLSILIKETPIKLESLADSISKGLKFLERNRNVARVFKLLFCQRKQSYLESRFLRVRAQDVDCSLDGSSVRTHEYVLELEVVNKRLLRLGLLYSTIVKSAVDKVLSAPNFVIVIQTRFFK